MTGKNVKLLTSWGMLPRVRVSQYCLAIVLMCGWVGYSFWDMRRQLDTTISTRGTVINFDRTNVAKPLPAHPGTAREAVDQHRLLNWLEMQSSKLRVAVRRITISAATKVTNQRARTEILLSLRGPYTSIKELLKELLDRHSNLELVNIDVAQVDGAQGAEAEVSVLWIADAPKAPGFEPPDMER